MSSALHTAQAVAQRLELSPDEGLFMQTLPNTFVAALARGEVNLVALAQEELASRGRDLQGRWVGFEAAKALMQTTPEQLDTFVADEHARVEAFRVRWQEAHAINPEQYPLALPPNNLGVWSEMLHDFDAQAPFELPEPAAPEAETRRRRSRQP